MEAFSKNQEQMRKAFGTEAAFGNFEHLARANREFFEQSLRMFSPFGSAAQPGEAPKEAEPETQSAVSGDLEAMQEQLRKMQSQIEKLSKSG